MSTAETIQRIQTIEHPYPLNVFTLNIATYILDIEKRQDNF